LRAHKIFSRAIDLPSLLYNIKIILLHSTSPNIIIKQLYKYYFYTDFDPEVKKLNYTNQSQLPLSDDVNNNNNNTSFREIISSMNCMAVKPQHFYLIILIKIDYLILCIFNT
jgi:hypothetical protein